MVPIRSRLAVLMTAASLAAGALLLGGAGPSQAVFGAQTFPGLGLGPIPDGGAGCAPSPVTPLNVTFNVTGMPTGAASDVRITGLTFGPHHTRAGEVVAQLIAPNGAQQIIFGRTGATTSVSTGDNSDLAGPYSFADDAPDNWWVAAGSAGDTAAIPSGSYRSSAVGGAGATGAVTSLTSAFSGVTNLNGTWTLRFTDGCVGDTGAVTAVTLELAPKCAPFESAVVTGQAKVSTANAAVSTATTTGAAADAAAKDAAAALKKAKKKLTKAGKALKAATTSGQEVAIQKAKKKLAKATKAFKKAKAAQAAALSTAAAAHQAVTSAQAAAIAAQAQLIAAQSALANCKST